MSSLHDRIAEQATEWALMCPLANWPPWRGLADDQAVLDALVRKLAAGWGDAIARSVADVVQPELDARDAEVAEALARLREAQADAERGWADAAKREVEATEWARTCRSLLEARQAAEQRAEQAEAAIARVRALHAPTENGYCTGCGLDTTYEEPVAADCCPTVAALDQPQETDHA